MLARVAWRNLWRNRRRTGIAIAALALGTAALVFSHSFAETFYATMIDLATRGLLGHLQVHGKGYQAQPDVFTVVKDPAAVRAEVERTLPGAVALERVTAFGLAASGERSAGVAIIGLDPEREAAHTRVLQIARGRTLAAKPAREVVVGDPLARRLRVEPGGEVVLLSQAADGSLANDVYTVVGVSKGGGTVEAGGAAIFLHLGDAQDFFALGPGVHQVVVNLPDGQSPRQAAATLRAALDPAALEALSWDEMMPEVQTGIEADRQGTFLMDVIVFLLVVLGMVNAMTMATYERTFELGVLSALGTRPGGVMATIVLEALFLGVVSLLVGVAVSWLVMAVLPPIHLGSMGEMDFIGVAFPGAMKLRVAPLALVMAVGTVVVTSLLGGLVPAWRAARLAPVVAMRSRT
jgi:putative ABC transport system permease protein